MPFNGQINFLRERVRLQEAVVESDKRLMLMTSIALGIFMTIVVGIAAYQYYLGQRVASLEGAILTQQTQLEGLQPIRELLSSRNLLLSTTQQVIEKRGKGWEAIDYVYSILPQGSAVDSIRLLAADNMMEFRVLTDDVFAYRRLSDTLQSQHIALSGYNPTMQGLSRDKTGKYSVNVELSVIAEVKPSEVPQQTITPEESL